MSFLRHLGAALIGLCCVVPGASAKTLGFVITTWHNALLETRYIDECPDGLTPGYDELWWRSLKPDDRGRLTGNGEMNRQDRYRFAIKRGPKGEDVCMNPTSVTDPPQHVVEYPYAYGFNLDGTSDGEATSKSCKHQKFQTPDTKSPVDNQLYRLTGCIYGFRSIGYFDANPNESRKIQSLGIILVKVDGVDDEANDNDVSVSFYRSVDPYALDSSGTFLPNASYRIDIDTNTGRPRYGDSVKGRIENGLLTTEPADVHLPYFGNYTFLNMLIRDMRIRLDIAPDRRTAKGMIGGYQEVSQLTYFVTGLGATVHADTWVNCPSFYVAAHQLADGYPDPKTGECTALSGAWNVEAVSAFVVNPLAEGIATAGRSPWRKALSFIGLGDDDK